MEQLAQESKKAIGKIGNYRWVICGLLFFAATINYIDRNVVSILKPMMLEWPGWSEASYGHMIGLFTLSYAIMMLFAGALIDRIGILKGFMIAIIWWSIAAMGHAISATVVSFMIWRVLLGFGEAANFPASIKAVAEWFPKKERALATGIFNSGTTLGALVTPFAIKWILDTFEGWHMEGWRWVFIITGLLGFIWVIFWLRSYRHPAEHPRLSKEELQYIQSEPDEKVEKVPWAPLLKFRQTWAFTIGKFLTDPVWWFWLFWAPGFFHKKFGVDVKEMGGLIFVIYTMAAVGSVIGGWLPAFFFKRGWSTNAARKTAMLICALLVVPVIFASVATNKWLAVALIGLACGAHQGWSANIFTLASDMFPKRAVGSVVGIGGAAGGIGGFVIANIVGWILDKDPNNYLPICIIAGAIYLISLVIIHLLVPKMEKAEI
ncbi:MAG: MFS transporter [Planctomycetaceae bacterium]|nr:MFS transporter [Planctomycetaceae bacterium]